MQKYIKVFEEFNESNPKGHDSTKDIESDLKRLGLLKPLTELIIEFTIDPEKASYYNPEQMKETLTEIFSELQIPKVEFNIDTLTLGSWDPNSDFEDLENAWEFEDLDLDGSIEASTTSEDVVEIRDLLYEAIPMSWLDINQIKIR